MTTLLAAILTSILLLSATPPIKPDTPSAQDSNAPFANAGDLLTALSEKDQATSSLGATIRYTVISALENDRQTRTGKLAIQTDPDDPSQRDYAVIFNTLEIDSRRETISEHFIFDGRWFVEKNDEEKQFIKRELVPAGKTLDPMELMRDAPFWVSLGHNQDRLLASYDAQIVPATDSLIDNEDFPELAFFAELPNIASAVQLKLTPKPGSGFEDDWEWVRIWINPKTLHPVLYIKSEWTGDLQIVELWSVLANANMDPDIFDTATPDARSGWRVQISPWRGQHEDQSQEPAGNNDE